MSFIFTNCVFLLLNVLSTLFFLIHYLFMTFNFHSSFLFQSLEDLKSKTARIIIADVVDQVARIVMCEAYKLQMTSREGYVWFLPVWLNTTWYDTDSYNKNRKDIVNCTTAEMIKVRESYYFFFVLN